MRRLLKLAKQLQAQEMRVLRRGGYHFSFLLFLGLDDDVLLRRLVSQATLILCSNHYVLIIIVKQW